jgi:hypothetical protein
MKKITFCIALMMAITFLVSSFVYATNLLISSSPEEMVEKVEPINGVESENITGYDIPRIESKSDNLYNPQEESNQNKIMELINSIINAIRYGVVISGLYLLVETIFIIIDKNVDAIWKKVINIFIAMVGLPCTYGILSLCIVVKLTSDKKAVKVVSNIVAILLHLLGLVILDIVA